ncbi:hypothetical protein MVG78_01785 [Roseomonas gilardii subsp. gilardii]|uniref:hypothetical protein n=1 Tax=Roseomonas gilardii TaxID=257708 RepID=UPI001FF84CA4|nr:hypothetical protein [Roseomonas gilardii]UPG72944.1 hypothetical protein MVG78_01785 [Roseomonas gilardii subsp. gilardii]
MPRKSLLPELVGTLAVTGTLLMVYLAAFLVMEDQMDHGTAWLPVRVALNEGPPAVLPWETTGGSAISP